MTDPPTPTPGDVVHQIAFRSCQGVVRRIASHPNCPMAVCAVVRWDNAVVDSCASMASIECVPESKP